MPAEIDPRALAARIARGEPTLLVDVREPWEHAQAALPGSVLVPLGELARRHGEIAAAPNTLVVTYCHHGMRSLDAARLLASVGFAGVVSLAGGIDAWSREVDPALPRY
jgi:sulfur-carrier protein adenylyltransferase/sulfurtransferase